ncbi:Hypothetical predicted protein [Mytilus galloprovincialis]|uniref:DZIP3-like HEPN domain-containing protein n=1 Tax=Mytilus galloprovincialis TaxID=29158 RepID=A0A8B6BRQ8_MYTGA|nr:Hypothetical predicted protein [Mytilus galloprovincialis]
MSGIEKENLLKLYMLLVGYTKQAIIGFFKLHLTKKGLNFEDFINLNQHDIYHLCYNTTKCCRPTCNISCKSPYVPRRILNPVQLDKLLDNTSTRLSYHKSTSTGEYCCCRGQSGIQTDVLDVTLANCLLINFCNELFWDCCLTQGQNITSFLDCNKHSIFHLTHGNKNCCMCSSSTSCSFVTQQTVSAYYWHLLFNKPSGKACGTSGMQCICSLSATVGLTNLNDECTRAFHKEYCSARKALDVLVNYRNIYGHPDTTCVPVAEYARVKNDICNSIMILATLSGQERQTRQKLSDLENISLDVQLCGQYRNTLLEQINRDRKLEEAITDLPDIMKSIVEDITNERFTQIEKKLDNLADIAFDSKRQSTIGEILRIHDDIPSVNNLSDSSQCSTKPRFQTGLKTAIQLLSSVKFLDPKLSAVVTTLEALFKIFGETPIEDELDRFIEDKTDEEIFCECEGTIQYFVSSIIFLSGIGIKSLGDCEFKFVCDNIKPFHGVLLMGKLWKKIDILKNLSIKRRNFTKLMSYIQAYMYLSFMRDLTSVLFCKILEISSSQNILKGMEVLMKHHKSRDKMLLQFLVEPTKNTLTFNIMYNSNNWPTIDNMLANYFFPKQKTQNPLSYLCDGEFVIKPLKYAGACLYIADIGCTWLRWSDEENEQSRFKFIQHKIDGKIYYQIFSVKWVEYYASLGLALVDTWSDWYPRRIWFMGNNII